MDDIEPLYDDILKWSRSAFPNADSVSHMTKLIQEAKEVMCDVTDPYEYADCLIALFAAAGKAGISLSELIECTHHKLKVNKTRKWTLLSDGTYQHIP